MLEAELPTKDGRVVEGGGEMWGEEQTEWPPEEWEQIGDNVVPRTKRRWYSCSRSGPSHIPA